MALQRCGVMNIPAAIMSNRLAVSPGIRAPNSVKTPCRLGTPSFFMIAPATIGASPVSFPDESAYPYGASLANPTRM